MNVVIVFVEKVEAEKVDADTTLERKEDVTMEEAFMDSENTL
jgi:hypothetical protein